MLKDMVDGPPLPQAMRIKNKGVLRVGVPSMQDLQKWAEQSQSSEDHKQLTLETFEAAPQWLAERWVNVKWKPVSVSSDMERKSSIFFASATDKCEPSSSAFEWRTEGSTKPISAYKFRSNIVHTYDHLWKEKFNLSATQIRMTSYKLSLLWRKGKTLKSV